MTIWLCNGETMITGDSMAIVMEEVQGRGKKNRDVKSSV